MPHFDRPESARLFLVLWLCAVGGCGGASHTGKSAEGASHAHMEPYSGDDGAFAGHPICPATGVAVQVLGSGGPIMDDHRASAGYLVWVDGKARLMVDAGGGTMLRFATTGARIEDLHAVAISHFHVDHSTALASFFKTASFGSRAQPLPLLGPRGDDTFPGTEAFMQRLIGEQGAYGYLARFLSDGNPFVVMRIEVDHTKPQAEQVFADDLLKIRAVGVPHPPVPTVAYEVAVANKRIAFMADQRADEQRYWQMIQGADLLVAHMAIPEGARGIAGSRHAPPAQLGKVAAETGVKRMLLSHLMQRVLKHKQRALKTIEKYYHGPFQLAQDGACYPVFD